MCKVSIHLLMRFVKDLLFPFAPLLYIPLASDVHDKLIILILIFLKEIVRQGLHIKSLHHIVQFYLTSLLRQLLKVVRRCTARLIRSEQKSVTLGVSSIPIVTLLAA
mgnify:CR=1 FL=1